jgi:hypothetical protein
MNTAVSSLLERVRQPAYTGENRCLPCTAVNVVIAIGLAGVVSFVATPVSGALVLGLSLAAIWLRGYLVPGTPELTKQYMPDWMLRLFGKAPELPAPGETVDVEAYLQELGAVHDVGDDVELTRSFAADWQDAIDAVKADPAAAAGEVLSLDDPGVETRGGATVVTDGGIAAANWPSEPALVADLAAVQVLSDRDHDWDERDHVERGRILAGLRIFLETCPACGGAPQLGEDTVESCCRSAQVYTYTCPDCDARLLEVEQ